MSWEAFERELAEHPDRTFANHVVSGIRDGFSLGYEGPQFDCFSGNMSSSKEHPGVVADYLETELGKGRVLGPFKEPPSLTFVAVRLVLCRRRRSRNSG